LEFDTGFIMPVLMFGMLGMMMISAFKPREEKTRIKEKRIMPGESISKGKKKRPTCRSARRESLN